MDPSHGSRSQVLDPGGRQFSGRVKSLVLDRYSWIESLGFRGRQYTGRVKSFFLDFRGRQYIGRVPTSFAISQATSHRSRSQVSGLGVGSMLEE